MKTPCVARHSFLWPSSSNDIFSSRFSGLENNRLRGSLVNWHRANPKEIPECGYFLIVLKHEGNMPFENDGLRFLTATEGN